MSRYGGSVEGLFHGKSFSRESPRRLRIDGTFTVYANDRSEYFCERFFRGTGGTLLTGQQQWYLILLCDDGIRRSFGQGTIVHHEYALVPSTA